ncbi:GTPase domain-containing protein [Planctomicrobium sp. SH527]|uniref:GTPase domain-containing protein n=1 Tax=Planctomicrobium sp. SH527 TaxID=3448123 RepID=UPI003F5B5E66
MSSPDSHPVNKTDSNSAGRAGGQTEQLIQQLSSSVRRLEEVSRQLNLPPLEGREWFELLARKLQPQMGECPYLVVAVVGGTNVGKSVIFNHIAGGRISATSPMASGTKHPTALIHPTLSETANVSALFPGFETVRWDQPEQPLQEDLRHLLFYRVTERTPRNLVILDSPDVDSVAVVNWERAAHLRQSADVLIAVLTQQKYNDAAIKTFFRSAADEGKLIIVVFNQCLLPEDEEYWPMWLKTWCEATGVNPDLVYLAPNDRRAAEDNRLPFYERDWPLDESGRPNTERPPRLLIDELSQLKFEEIKERSLSGAVHQVVSNDSGIPAWLREIERRSNEYADALQLLTADRLAEVSRWPSLPNSVLIQQVREWWGRQREGWTASVHGFYSKLGSLVTAPLTLIRQRRQVVESPLEIYRKQEWQTVLDVLESGFNQLERIRDVGNPLLRDQIAELLSGVSRAAVIDEVRREHQELDLEKDISQFVEQQLSRFREESPEYYRLFRGVDAMAAFARPAVSVALFATGAGPIADAMVPVVTNSLLQGALHVAGDAAGGAVATAVGDQVLAGAAGQGAGYLETRFRELHTSYSRHRALWLSERLNRLVLRGLPAELASAAQVKGLPECRNVRQIVLDLQRLSGSSILQKS